MLESEARLRFLADAGLVLASSLDYEATLKSVAALAIQSLADFCFVDLLDELGQVRRVAWEHRDPETRRRLDARFHGAIPMPQDGNTFSRALGAGEPIFAPQVDDAWMQAAARSPEHLEFMRSMAAHSVMIVPITTEARVIGAITFCRSGPRKEQHSRADLELAMELGRRAGVAVSHARQHQALAESEARFRNMADSAPALIWMTDAAGELVFANMHHDYLFGVPAAEMLSRGWHRFLPPEDLEACLRAFAAAFSARAKFTGEFRAHDKDGNVRWLRSEGVPRLSDTGEFLGYTGCAIDVTDAKVAERHRELLINELNHRVKNTLASVQAIVAQTLRTAKTREEVSDALTARLLTLARAHDLLTAENWSGADLSELVRATAELHQAPGESRFEWGGPPIRLPPRAALSLSLGLHELATNAVKYGALSNGAGKVRVMWRASSGDGGEGFALEWAESGGPVVEPPTRKGFGTRLLEQGLASDLGAKVLLRHEATGVVFSIEAPAGG